MPRAGTGAGGSSAGQVADGGNRVVFQSPVDGLVAGDANGENDLFLRDRRAGTTVRVSVGPGGREADAGSFAPDLSPDGRWLAFCSSATDLLRRRVAVPDRRDPAIYLRDRW